jgi:hypothetical protein
MYLTFNQFCTCLKAQLKCRKNINEKNQEAIDEIEKGQVE